MLALIYRNNNLMHPGESLGTPRILSYGLDWNINSSSFTSYVFHTLWQDKAIIRTALKFLSLLYRIIAIQIHLETDEPSVRYIFRNVGVRLRASILRLLRINAPYAQMSLEKGMGLRETSIP